MTVNHMGQKEALATVVIEFLNFVDSPFPRPMPETISSRNALSSRSSFRSWFGVMPARDHVRSRRSRN